MLLHLFGCLGTVAVGSWNPDSLVVEITAESPTRVAPVALELRVSELVFEAEGPLERASVATQVDVTFTPLVRSNSVSLALESGTHHDGALTLYVAADEGPALVFAASRGEDLVQIHADDLTFVFPVEALEVQAEPLYLTILLRPDEWLVDRIDGLVDSTSGALYDEVADAIEGSAELQGLP